MTDEQFLERWQFWRKGLSSGDSNSLVPQMNSICWNIATYEAIRASWKKELAEDGDTLNVNRILFHFITNNFSKCLCMDLRRLTEAGTMEKAEPDKEDKSVYSVASLLSNIKEYRCEYTRRRMFSAVKLEYDAELIKRRHDEFVSKMIRGPMKVWSVPQDLWDFPTIQTHIEWDRICHRDPSKRSPDDIIALNYIETLDKEINSIRKAIRFVANKFFAHASTPKSRESANDKEAQVSINQLYDLTLRCGHIVNSISMILRDAIYPFLAIAQWDKWEEWERGWNGDHHALEEAWQEWGNRVERLEPIFS